MSLNAGAAGAAEEIVLQLRWDNQFQFAGYYAAKWQGLYEEAGLEVEIRPGVTPDNKILSSTTEVSKGRADFGVSASDIIVARSEGAPIQIVASFFQTSPVGIFSRKDLNVTSPADLAGLRVRRTWDDLADLEFRAILDVEGVDPDTIFIDEDRLERPFNLFKSGKIDAYAGYTLTALWRARQEGIQLFTIRPATYGIDFYGDSLFVHENLARENPELVEKFRQASIQGWRYALEHPIEIADRITNELSRQFMVPDLKGFNRFQAEEVTKLALYPVIQLGHLNTKRWQKMHDTIKQAGMIAAPVEIDDMIFDYERQIREQEHNTIRQLVITLASVMAVLLAIVVLLGSYARIQDKGLIISHGRLLALSAVLAAGILAFDLYLPLGVAGGVPYVVLVFIGGWYPKRTHVFVLAFIASGLTVLGFFLSPESGIGWMVLTNRGLALFAIWATAILVFNRRSIEKELIKARDNLECRVQERTQELTAEIAERKRAEDTSHKLSRAINQSPSMVFITDTEGRIEYINSKFVELTGFGPQEVYGANPRILKSGNTPQGVYTELWRTITSGKEWRGELKDKCKDGSTFWASVTISPVKSPDGAITNFISVHEDITERKKAEQAMNKAREQAEIANRAKTEILANMSHELRTPLNAIIGFSSVLAGDMMGNIPSEKQREYMTDIKDSGEHLLHLINDVLDVSAIEAGKMEINEEELQLIPIFESAIRLVSPRLKEGEINLTSELPEDLPPLRADERRLKQILLNILTNAAKFTPPGGDIKIEAMLAENGSLVFSVTDTGIGMDRAGLAKAMTQFGQVDETLTRSEEGTGLGLPLTKGLVELHGGTLEIFSDKGVGTTVTVTLPKERVLSDLMPLAGG